MASTSHPSVYVLDPYHQDAISLLKKSTNLEIHLPDDPDKADWVDKADGVLLRSDTRLTAESFEKAKRLRFVVKQGVGVDNIDLAAAKKHNIAVHNTPGANSEAVAELAMSLAFALARRLPEYDRGFRSGKKLVRSQMLGVSLFEKTVGIIGMGNIGRQLALKFSQGANCKIIGYDPVAPKDAWPDIPHTRASELEELLRESDVISLHVPLIDSTRGMIGEKELEMMKDTTILINAARGGVVDEPALFKALKEKKIWGAALDAMVIEPPTAEAYPEWVELDNVIITPHAGASTRDTQSVSGRQAVQTLVELLEGKENVKGKVV